MKIIATSSFWSQVLFSNESKFSRLGSDGKQYEDEEFNSRCTIPALQGSGGSVMVRDFISAYGSLASVVEYKSQNIS